MTEFKSRGKVAVGTTVWQVKEEFRDGESQCFEARWIGQPRRGRRHVSAPTFDAVVRAAHQRVAEFR